jgi:hypothetical protein
MVEIGVGDVLRAQRVAGHQYRPGEIAGRRVDVLCCHVFSLLVGKRRLFRHDGDGTIRCTIGRPFRRNEDNPGELRDDDKPNPALQR